MKTLAESIAAANFSATPTQIESLAALVQTGSVATGVYLQTLIAATQAALPRSRKLSIASCLAALEAAYAPSYEAVQRGVAGSETLTPRELASRCGFARTSASALRKWLQAGGNIRTLVPGQVSRRDLRPEGPEIPAGTTRAERAVLLAVARVVRVAERTATKDEAAARALLETAVESLSARLDAMADGNSDSAPAPRVTATRLQRVPAGQAARA